MTSTSDSKPTVDSIATVDDLQLADVGDKFNKGSGEKDGTSTTESNGGNTDTKAKEKSEIYNGSNVEVMPEFPGGEAALLKFIANTVSYPDRERELGIEGKVVVGFIIDETGSVTDVTAIKKLSAGLDNESVRVVKMLPKFKPGMQGGRPVKVRYVLPIKYQYQ